MNVAYVDPSVLTAIALGKPGAEALAGRLDGFARLVSSNLLEAELRATFAREKADFPENVIAGFDWILPDRTPRTGACVRRRLKPFGESLSDVAPTLAARHLAAKGLADATVAAPGTKKALPR